MTHHNAASPAYFSTKRIRLTRAASIVRDRIRAEEMRPGADIERLYRLEWRLMYRINANEQEQAEHTTEQTEAITI